MEEGKRSWAHLLHMRQVAYHRVSLARRRSTTKMSLDLSMGNDISIAADGRCNLHVALKAYGHYDQAIKKDVKKRPHRTKTPMPGRKQGKLGCLHLANKFHAFQRLR